MNISWAIALITGYLLGCINPAYFFGKMKGFDIRTVGSKNAGASNAKLMLGWKYFVIVLLYDALKAIISVLIIRYIFPDQPYADVLAGCAAIFGHCFPFYLDFRGGKGFASYVGLALILDWKAWIMIIVIALALAFITNYIVTATMTLSFSLPVYNYLAGTSRIVCLMLLCTSLLIVFQHRSNFVKLMNGEEIGINGKHIGFKKSR